MYVYQECDGHDGKWECDVMASGSVMASESVMVSESVMASECEGECE